MKLIMENWRKFLNEEESNLFKNIRAKRARGEKPAKPGDEDYPSEKSWKKATQDESIEEDSEKEVVLSEQMNYYSQALKKLH